MGNILPWAPVSSLALSVVFILLLCARSTWMGTNTSSRLDSGVQCVKFAIVTDSKTMDSKDVGAAESPESSMA